MREDALILERNVFFSVSVQILALARHLKSVPRETATVSTFVLFFLHIFSLDNVIGHAEVWMNDLAPPHLCVLTRCFSISLYIPGIYRLMDSRKKRDFRYRHFASRP